MSYTSENIISNKTLDITNFDYHKEKGQTGFITMYPAGATIPDNWLLCNGQSVSTATYPDLFGLIVYTYGGSGTNFTIPNLNNYLIVGTTSASNIGTTSGAWETTLNIAHFPSHSHTIETTSSWMSPSYSASYSSGMGTNGKLYNGADTIYGTGWGTIRSDDYLNTANRSTRGSNAALSVSSGSHSHSCPAGSLDSGGSNSNTYSLTPESVKLYFIIKAS